MDLDIEKLREEVKGIEAEIKSMIGQSGNDVYYVDIPEGADRGRLKELLMSRHHSLDMLFRRDPEGVERFHKVNACLKDLSDRLYMKGARIYRQYLTYGIDEEFDDDFMIDADLRFVYNGPESVAVLGDEEYYGSDFNYMMNVIYDYCKDFPNVGASYSKSFGKTDRPEMTDSELELANRYDYNDWGEIKIWIPELEGIKICNAVNEICVYENGYSVADLLRMNYFWCEVKGVYQLISDRNGEHMRLCDKD